MKSDLRDLRGRHKVVEGWGADLGGDGWRRVVNGTGDYTIYFDSPFATRPVVNVDADNSGTPLVARVYSSDRFSFRVMLFNSTNGGNVDSGFHFRAEGVADV